MPKLTPKQQQKKLRRHNPIARTTTASGSAAVASNSSQLGQQEDVIPVINSLPLTSSPSAPVSLEEDEKVHRALLSLNPLLLTKTSRVALLAPKHMLLQRLLHHLDHHRLEVRKEAAGCLRNLCVEGQWSGREQVWNLGGGATALAQIQYAAEELGLLPKTDRAQVVSQTVPEAVGAAKKSEEMNRKERRQAAKANKTSGGAAATPDSVAPAIATPASAAAEADAHDLHLLHLSLLENHLTIIWCLLETVTSPLWLTQLNKSILGGLLCSAIARGASAYTGQASSTGKITQKERDEIKNAELDVALTAANVLATWIEDNAAASASLVGLPVDLAEQVVAFEQGGNSSAPGTKSRKRLETILDKFGSISSKQASAGKARLDQMASAASLLSTTRMSSPEDVQRLNLGLLALASCSNILTALPAAIRAWVPAPASATSSCKTLMQWQVSEATPLLLQFLNNNGSSQLWTASAKSSLASGGEEKQKLQAESGMDVDVQRDGNGEDAQDEGEDAPASSLTTRKVDTMTLAMELLGEICTEAGSEDVSLLPGSTLGDGDSEDDGEDMEEDDDGDREGSEDTLDSEQEQEMLMLTEADRAGASEGKDDDGDLSMEVSASKPSNVNGTPSKSKNGSGGSRRKWESPYSTLFVHHKVAAAILDILSAQAAVESEFTGTSLSSRDFTLASHSTLASLLSAIASYGQPPPTHPLEEGSRKERQVRLFQKWVAEQSESVRMVWSGLMPWAERVQTALAAPGAAPEAAQWSSAVAQPIWTSLNALVVMHEGLEVLPISLSGGQDGQSDIERIFTTPLMTMMSYKGPEGAHAAQAASLIISTLAYHARIPVLAIADAGAQQLSLLERNKFAADCFLSILALYTSPSSAGAGVGSASQPSEILPLLATLNALIDLYADETSTWDEPIFRSYHLLGKLQSLTRAEAGGRVIRERIRAIDKRREEALRSMAEETWENWGAWVGYRVGLGLGE
ncbi:hypothetical protein BCV69DRAFT_281175 [Microstroma glucosiphilum]|uniref:ARM repeat-containing protein n=1 Tax=Pseudomicrostroma glucosiphilum TaxID=1684307 RepID=A0A316UAB8_9BASI|nr:hypothetical protein BCV69DRAFT_281175 [Pseudomicrostroma glucosiphilum]PWN22170.1 hypothetical protein BCV69DRAFT_281175 [Pseudomicrostroma glucosiphilum]